MMAQFSDLTPSGGVQYDRHDLVNMTNEEIAAAHKSGGFQMYMANPAYVRERDTSRVDEIAAADARVEAISSGIRSARDFDRFKADPPAFIREILTEGPPPPRQLTRADLQAMTPEEINQARLDGQLNDLLGIQ